VRLGVWSPASSRRVTDKMTIIKDYKAKIETELVEICNDILSIIEDSSSNSTSEEAKVFTTRW
jgi:14-3-3 protein epsilon